MEAVLKLSFTIDGGPRVQSSCTLSDALDLPECVSVSQRGSSVYSDVLIVSG